MKNERTFGSDGCGDRGTPGRAMKHLGRWAGVIVSICVASAAFADMGGTRFQQKFRATTGLSKIKVTRVLKPGNTDAASFVQIDPCNVGPNDIDILIQGDTQTFEKKIDLTGTWLSTCGASKAKSFADTGDCQVKYSTNYGDGILSLVKAKLTILCTLPWIVDSLNKGLGNDVVAIYFDYNNYYDDICFYPPTSPYGNSPSVVKRDGSDGKSIILLSAPVDACEN